MFLLPVSAIQACLSLVFLLVLFRIDTGRGILLPSLAVQDMCCDPARLQRLLARRRRLKKASWWLLIGSAAATLSDLSPTLATFFQ